MTTVDEQVVEIVNNKDGRVVVLGASSLAHLSQLVYEDFAKVVRGGADHGRGPDGPIVLSNAGSHVRSVCTGSEKAQSGISNDDEVVILRPVDWGANRANLAVGINQGVAEHVEDGEVDRLLPCLLSDHGVDDGGVVHCRIRNLLFIFFWKGFVGD